MAQIGCGGPSILPSNLSPSSQAASARPLVEFFRRPRFQHQGLHFVLFGRPPDQPGVQHRSGVHHMFPSSTNIQDGKGNVLVTSYAVHRPDGNWSLMLVNRDETHPHTMRVLFEDSASQPTASFLGAANQVSFSSEQYVWKDDGAHSYADPDGPPVGAIVSGGPQASFTLPKASVTVLRGQVEGGQLRISD